MRSCWCLNQDRDLLMINCAAKTMWPPTNFNCVLQKKESLYRLKRHKGAVNGGRVLIFLFDLSL